VGLVAESGADCNLRQRLLRGPQSQARKFKPSRCDVLEWRYPYTRFESSEQLSDADINQNRQIISRDLLGEMLLDVVDDPNHLPEREATP